MKASQFFLNTLKESPADAEIASHRLMMRAGMIKKLAGGIYTLMPLGLRAVRKVENIVRDEMNRAGALEVLMPAVQPAELWQESGRWEQYGPELLRLRDRHAREFVIGPTHEEVITDVARREIKSYRQLPVNFYQIQTKFRDEIRPRFGVMRGREFIMKDAYSFDRNVAGALQTYDRMYGAYQRIFTRLGLNFRAVAADTGSIGGSRSHEFHVIADTGEDAIAYDPASDYAANVELAEAVCTAQRAAAAQPLTKVATPGREKCADIAAFLQQTLAQTVKAVVFAEEGASAAASCRLLMVLVRGDHEVNEIKVGKLPGVASPRLATDAEIRATFSCPPGYLGPLGAPADVRIIADRSVAALSDFICGANEADQHYTGVNWARDLPEPFVADVRNVVVGDPNPVTGQGTLDICRGIEVGHVFYLGTKYSAALQATCLDENGKPALMEMGCYGIGVTRILGAAIEQNHDDKGMFWPVSMAPFELVICPVGYYRSAAVREAADALHDELSQRGIDVILDDRDERPGAMFADWELIGAPFRLTVGERGLKDGKLEWQVRRSGQMQELTLAGAADFIGAQVQSAHRELTGLLSTLR
ncbi:MAG: proline--tRNA ligase [Burkholderiaceae bacterium]